MLRRKLLLILSPLVALLVVTSVVAIWLLQGMLQRLDHVNREAWVVVDDTTRLGATISTIEMELYQLQVGKTRHLDRLIDAYELMQQLVADIGKRPVVHEPDSGAVHQRLQEAIPVFGTHVGALATAEDPELADKHNQAAQRAAMALRQDILALGAHASEHAQREQQSLYAEFRWVVLGLAVVFLLVINISVIVLLRMSAIILRPVDKLVEASRQLAQERFDYRVELDQKDEFGELAQAYNSLAEQLQANEKRKIEMLGQVALTLNHELNNAIATINLQLQLMGRQTGGNEVLEKRLRQIHESLERMTHTVELLKHVRRIVLTDYVSGVKMLDLHRSVEESPAAPATAVRSPQAQA